MTPPSPSRGPAAEGPQLPPRMRIYAIGDVHGRLDLLKATFRKIDQDWLDAPIFKSVEVLLGDYVDRGPDSKGVIDRLIERSRTRKLVCLRGNHEQMMLDALDDPWRLKPWLQVGGAETMVSYDVPPPAATSAAFEGAARALASALPESHRQFFSSLPTHYECGDYFFVHAGVRPGVPLAEQSPDDLLWIREPFLSSRADFGKRVVHGHTPAPEPDMRPNRINIDTGAYATGRLTCLVIDRKGARFL